MIVIGTDRGYSIKGNIYHAHFCSASIYLRGACVYEATPRRGQASTVGAPDSRWCPVLGPQEPRDRSGDRFSKERGSEACLSQLTVSWFLTLASEPTCPGRGPQTA